MTAARTSRTRKRGRGRPAHKPTAKTRQTVEQLKMCGMTHKQIALTIEISEETLTKHYADELENGITRQLAALYQQYYADAKKGSVVARRRLIELGTAALAQQGFEAGPARAPATAPEAAPPAPRETTLGKKEQANKDALTAGQGSAWGDDLKPPGSPQSSAKH